MTTHLDSIVSIVENVEKLNSYTDIAVWTGKPLKGRKRFFVYFSKKKGKVWLAKVAQSYDQLLANEHEALFALDKLFSGTVLQGTIPAHVYFSNTFLVQEWKSGRSLTETIVRSRRRLWMRSKLELCCLRIIDWLIAFHQLGCAKGQMVMSTKGICERLGAVHGDFKPSNILIDNDGNLAVLDWELFSQEGTQLFDVLHFVTYLGLGCAGKVGLEGFKIAFQKQTWISRIVRSLFQRYIKEMELPNREYLEVYQRYLEFNLKRRNELGLSNAGYFIQKISDHLNVDRPKVYVFDL